MKRLLLIPIIFLTACASHSPKTNFTALRASAAGQPVDTAALRTDEQLKEYRFGRYIDPRDPLAMHEGHPIYRVESTARWDLRPQTGATVSPRQTVAATNTSTNDAIVAEVNKQRAATRAFTEQTAALNQKLGELSQAVKQTEEIAKQNLSLKKDVADLREHLDALEAQLNQSKPAPSAQPSPEDKW
jgi:uncharacterized lipoprotein YmbA